MKKIILLLSLFLFFLTPKPSFAQLFDKYCCLNGTYNPSAAADRQCEYSGLPYYGAIRCPAGEVCTVSGYSGLCSQPGSTGDTCCDSSQGYSPYGQSQCSNTNNLDQPIIDNNCGPNETCKDNTCILEAPATNTPSSPKPCVNGQEGIETAIGCLPTNVQPFVNFILTRGISIGAGLAFMLMLYGAFVLITSAGNPENTKKGKEIITSAIIGLLFIIFSVFLLKVIGLDILKLPNFQIIK
jgi:type IV secretion system pilin